MPITNLIGSITGPNELVDYGYLQYDRTFSSTTNGITFEITIEPFVEQSNFSTFDGSEIICINKHGANIAIEGTGTAVSILSIPGFNLVSFGLSDDYQYLIDFEPLFDAMYSKNYGAVDGIKWISPDFPFGVPLVWPINYTAVSVQNYLNNIQDFPISTVTGYKYGPWTIKTSAQIKTGDLRCGWSPYNPYRYVVYQNNEVKVTKKPFYVRYKSASIEYKTNDIIKFSINATRYEKPISEDDQILDLTENLYPSTLT